MFGGTLHAQVTVDGGRGADLGVITLPPRRGPLAAVALPLLVLALVIPLAVRSRRRSRWLRFLQAIQDLLDWQVPAAEVRARFEGGFEAQRARFAALRQTELQAEIDGLSPVRFQQLRAPRNRAALAEIQRILGRRPSSVVSASVVMKLVGDLVRDKVQRSLAAEMKLRSIPDAEVERIVRSSPGELRNWLHAEAASDPDLRTASAEKHLGVIQKTLEEQQRPEAIAWLVGSAGSDMRGRTIQLEETNAVGWAADAKVLLPRTPATLERHATITRRGDGYVVRPLAGGTVLVNGRTVAGSEELRDGATIVFGTAAFVFMSEIERG